MLECEKISETFSTLPPDKLNFESLVIEENSEDSNCWRDEVLKDLRKLQRLRVEDSSKISADDLAKIIKEGYSLRELCLSYSQLTEDLLRVIARENVSLQTMRIEAHSDTKPLARISDTAWTALQTHSPNLNLVMTCYLEDDEDYEVVLAPPITHLYLGGSPSSHVIRRVSENCPRLVELVINSCSSGVIDNELLTTARDCPELSAIGLGDCEVTCSALVQFAKICKQRLQILYVWETSLIEDENFDVADAVSSVSSSLGRSWTPEYVPPW
ncbi:F-box/LRR-repeat protein 21 isoform X2 [Diachasma alloeum]|uniref:F-box/LRR-repeat protein 21 isoform X2 n=1 Tax=Diachasma alloeum TaxID=454923 RepID=UPI0007384A45|nr:F-box/LRR-repeat protein 21 isoform X2 [Diachasma alloeum]